MVLVIKNLLANAGDTRDVGFIPGSERSPGGGHGNPLQYSCLENTMDRGAWWATVYGIAELGTAEVTWHACTYSVCVWSTECSGRPDEQLIPTVKR